MLRFAELDPHTVTSRDVIQVLEELQLPYRCGSSCNTTAVPLQYLSISCSYYPGA